MDNPAAETLIDRLSASLFWDVDPATIDPNRHRDFVIRRVAERGTMGEVRDAWRHYGEAAFREALLTAPALGAKTLSYFANQFRLPRERFRAYQQGTTNWQG